MKYIIQTLGCAMNYSDSERISAILDKLGYERTSLQTEADLYIFNTCSIRQKGEDRVYGVLKALGLQKRYRPGFLVGITGCMVRKTSTRNSEKIDRDDLIKRIDTVDFVFKISDVHKLGELLVEAEPKLALPGLEEAGFSDYLRVTPDYSSKFQAFVPVQVGCDKYCTYCIVPYARGREKSRPMADILDECTSLVENGCKEITLVGQTVNSYGKSVLDKQSDHFVQFEDPFVELLTRIDKLQIKGLNRLRFTSSHPRDFSDALINAHAVLPTLTRHIHLPVQAGDDEMLKRMNRQYTVAKYRTIIEKIRKLIPGISITTDIIVGFCGETDKQFEGTRELFEELQWDMAFLARYSPRPGTVSEKIWKDDISREVKASRWHDLNNLLNKSSFEYHRALVGKELEVLVEKYIPETGECEGRSRENKLVQFSCSPKSVGQIVYVLGTIPQKWLIKGKLVS